MKKSWIKILALIIITGLCIPVFASNAYSVEKSFAERQEEAIKKVKNSVVLYIGSPNSLVRGKIQPVDKNTSVVPYIENGRTMAPLSFIAISTGAKVAWVPENNEILITKDGKTIKFQIGSDIMEKDGTKIKMDTTAVSKNGRTMIPLAYAAQAFDIQITYDRGLIILDSQKNVIDPTEENVLIDALIASVGGLPIIGDKENFERILNEIFASYAKDYGYYEGGLIRRNEAEMLNDDMAASTASADAAPSMATSAPQESGDYSATNVQVEGVDEADVVKTDGEYIYHITSSSLKISKVYPTSDMRLVSTIDFIGSDSSFYPYEAYVDGKYLSVIGNFYENWLTQENSSNKSAGQSIKSYIYGNNGQKLMVYDISDKSKPVLTREFAVEGNYVSSRKIGNIIYLITNKYADYYFWKDGGEITPMVKGTAEGPSASCVEFSKIQYFPGSADQNFISICGIDIDKPLEKAQVTTLLGAGESVYMSLKNLYITKYNYYYIYRDTASANEEADSTNIYRFALADGLVTATGSGKVPGNVLNQFSMDEQGNFFRVATTSTSNDGQWKNGMYVLDSLMSICGKVTDIAPGERIYSVRFMGDRAFMVTYRTVDPLFGIDMKDPYSPKVLGALKIPGYSTYLHPYDENHLIGFGMDTLEVKDDWGGIRALNQGLKMALFDISDITDPKEKFVVTIGDRGTYSDLLYNHKALLFSKEKGIIAFPVNLYESKDKEYYGYFTYQGAYVYNIDVETGFSLRGRISHINDDEYKLYGNYDGDYDKYVQRILYIGNVFYTVSNKGVQANKMDNTEFISRVIY